MEPDRCELLLLDGIIIPAYAALRAVSAVPFRLSSLEQTSSDDTNGSDLVSAASFVSLSPLRYSGYMMIVHRCHLLAAYP